MTQYYNHKKKTTLRLMLLFKMERIMYRLIDYMAFDTFKWLDKPVVLFK